MVLSTLSLPNLLFLEMFQGLSRDYCAAEPENDVDVEKY